MTAEEHARLLHDYGEMRVRVHYRGDENVLGVTPDGKEFTGWAMVGDTSGGARHPLGTYQLRTLRWNSVGDDNA